MKLNRKRISKGGQLVLTLHPDTQLPECVTEEIAVKIRCIAESVYAIMDCEDQSEKSKLNYIKCAITSAFMLGKNDAYARLHEE